MLKKLLIGKFRSVTSAALVISFAGLASRLLGVVRDRVLAGQFGAGVELDMYYAAFRAPDLVYNLIVLGALSAGFIPVFTGMLKNDEGGTYKENRQAWDLVNNVLTIFSFALIVVCGLLFILAPYIVPLITPGFSGGEMQTTVALTRVMFLSPILLGLSGIFGGVLQSFKRFLAFSLAPILYNVGIIFGALVLVNVMGVFGLAWGVIIGAGMHLLIQAAVTFKLGFLPKWRFNWRDKNMRTIAKLMGPRVLGLATSQVNLIVVTIFGSLIAAGSIAIYNLATNLQTFPVGLVGISYAIAAFPALSKAHSKSNKSEFKKTFRQTFRLILFAIVPLTALFIILRIQIVRIILGAGLFSWDDTVLTANTLGVFSISLFAQALIPLLARAFYARHNTWTPFIAGLVSAVVNIFLSWILLEPFGVLGLALAFTLSSIINFVILVVALRWEIGNFGENRILLSFIKAVTAAVAMAVVVQALKYPIAQVVDMQRFWGIFVQGTVAGLVGLGVFALVCHWLKCTEWIVFKEGVKKRLFKKVKVEESIRGVEGT